MTFRGFTAKSRSEPLDPGLSCDVLLDCVRSTSWSIIVFKIEIAIARKKRMALAKLIADTGATITVVEDGECHVPGHCRSAR